MFSVVLTLGAERDLEEIAAFLVDREGEDAADELLDRLMATWASLRITPERGSYPKELLAVGVKQYRQVLLSPYRFIYQVVADQVVIHLIAHERRDFRSLLERRLLS